MDFIDAAMAGRYKHKLAPSNEQGLKNKNKKLQ
jgi:hypothetical protein